MRRLATLLFGIIMLGAGCLLGIGGGPLYVPEDYYVCEQAVAPITFCEQYYRWNVGYDGFYGYWHEGRYVIRDGWHRRGGVIRDHR